MATTKIWKTRGWLGKALIYIENPEKTANPMVVGNPNMSKEQYQSLADVIEYAADTSITEKELFVSGVNCNSETAREEMIATKKCLWEK